MGRPTGRFLDRNAVVPGLSLWANRTASYSRSFHAIDLLTAGSAHIFYFAPRLMVWRHIALNFRICMQGTHFVRWTSALIVDEPCIEAQRPPRHRAVAVIKATVKEIVMSFAIVELGSVASDTKLQVISGAEDNPGEFDKDNT